MDRLDGMQRQIEITKGIGHIDHGVRQRWLLGCGKSGGKMTDFGQFVSTFGQERWTDSATACSHSLQPQKVCM